MAVLALSKKHAIAASTQDDSLQASSETNADLVNVLVQWNHGKTLCLQVLPTTCLADLATLVWQHAQNNNSSLSLPSSRDFCMIYRGKALNADDDHDDTVADVIGEHQHVMHLQVWPRTRGGCFMVSFSILGVILASIVGSFCTCGLSLLIVPVLLPLLFILPLFCL